MASSTWPALHRAAMADDEDAVVRLVAEYDINDGMDDSVYSGWTALHLAAMRGFTSLVDKLLELGADPSAEGDDDEETPLSVAAGALFDPTIVVSLLRAGSDVNHTSTQGVTPLMVAAAKVRGRIVRVLLDDPNIDLTLLDDAGNNVLHHALQVPIKQIMGDSYPVLPDAQAIAYDVVCAGFSDFDARNVDGFTPLSFSSPAFIELLKLVAENAALLKARFPTLPDLIARFSSNEPGIAAKGVKGLSVQEQTRLIALCSTVEREQFNEVEVDNARGGCPFLPPVGATKVVAAPGGSVADAAAAGGCPFAAQLKKQENEASEAQARAAAAEAGGCPYAPQLRKAAEAETSSPAALSTVSTPSLSTVSTPFLSSKGAVVASKGKCPIPFHRQLSMLASPAGLALLAASVAIGVAVWLRTRK